MPEILLALADDQRLFSETLKLLLQTIPDFEVLFTGDNAESRSEEHTSELQSPY